MFLVVVCTVVVVVAAGHWIGHWIGHDGAVDPIRRARRIAFSRYVRVCDFCETLIEIKDINR